MDHPRQRHLLVTAGPTHEPIDAVRYIANRSSGRMGIAVAEASAARGWATTLLLGPTQLPTQLMESSRNPRSAAPAPAGNSRLSVHRFRTTEELRTLLLQRWNSLESDDVLITTGAQQGIDLALRTFTAPGDAVAVAIPTYQQLFGLLKAHGLNLVPVTSGPMGPDLDDLDRALSRRSVRMLYLMPTFHNPTGRTMDMERRKALMDLVKLSDVPVLEDEYEMELRFRGESLPSLRSMDSRGLTVSVHTFSKGLFPGLRMGWVQACREVLAPMAAVKRFMDLETSPLMQAALCEFIASGCLDRHIRDLRVELSERHRVAQEALTAHMPGGCTWSRPEGGFALWTDLPEKGQGDRLAELAATRGVLVTPGCVFDPLGRPSTGIRLSLSRCGAKTIRTGIRVLGQCAHEVLGTDPPSQTRLFL